MSQVWRFVCQRSPAHCANVPRSNCGLVVYGVRDGMSGWGWQVPGRPLVAARLGQDRERTWVVQGGPNMSFVDCLPSGLVAAIGDLPEHERKDLIEFLRITAFAREMKPIGTAVMSYVFVYVSDSRAADEWNRHGRLVRHPSRPFALRQAICALHGGDASRVCLCRCCFFCCVLGQFMRVVPRLHCHQDREAAWRRYVGGNVLGPGDLHDTVYAAGAVFTIDMTSIGLGHLVATRELWTNEKGQWRLGRDLVRRRTDSAGQVLYTCEMEMEMRRIERVRSVQPHG